MRVPPGVFRRLAPAILVFSSVLSLACDQLPAGETLWARLTSPVSSYTSKVGEPVHAVLTEDVACENGVIFPAGTAIEGRIRLVHKVGWGIRHETAALAFEFTRAEVGPGVDVPLSASLVSVENAREQVSKGVVQGIRSSNSPQGRITSRLKYLPTLNPYPDAGLLIFKATFPIFPEPEIYFPAGTDLRLKLNDPVTSAASLVALPPTTDPAVEDEVARLTQALPRRTTTQLLAEADVVNVAFLGSRQQLETAFASAGWNTSDTFNRHSFARNFYAFLNNSGYAQAPMRPFLLDGKTDDMNWQKSLNSYAKRDHLRVWAWGDVPGNDGQELWLSSATHDTSASLSLKHHQFVHHITPEIDEERDKVIRDLRVAGCVQRVYMIPRPGMTTWTQNATGDTVLTDGRLAVVELKNCQPSLPQVAQGDTNFKAGNKVFRYFRRTILTVRSDLWRANIIYAGYDLGHMGFDAFRQHHSSTMALHPAVAGSANPVQALN